jgi:hypothetical protein
MADDLAAMQRQLDELLRAYRSGVLSCDYDGKRVAYRNAEDMRAAIASLKAALGAKVGSVVVVRATQGW